VCQRVLSFEMPRDSSNLVAREIQTGVYWSLLERTRHVTLRHITFADWMVPITGHDESTSIGSSARSWADYEER